MASITPCWRLAAYLCFVIRIYSDLTGQTVTLTRSAPMSTRGPNQTFKTDVREELHIHPTQAPESIIEFRTYIDTHWKEKTLACYDDKDTIDLNQNFLPKNKIKCPPCFCRNTSSESVSVFCKDCIFTSIPQNFSIETGEIIINLCVNLKALDLNTLLIYTSLTSVKITTYNLNRVFSSSHLNISSTVIELDLRRNRITTVEDNCFGVFPNLLKLSIAWNDLEKLTKQMFTGLRTLRNLSVARNYIKFIAKDTFDGLGNLVSLDMSENKIIYTGYDLLPVSLFIPLKNLEELYIHDVCKRGTNLCGLYPNKALQALTNLRLLSIDLEDSRGLGPEIKSLIHLKHLIIESPVSIKLTAESYFDNVPSITTLDLARGFDNVNPKSFTRLKQLVNLKYSLVYGYNNICQVFNDMQYFVGSSLKYLAIHKDDTRAMGCNILKAQEAKYLSLLGLIELDLSGNALVDLSPEFIKMLPATLKRINLCNNGLSPQIMDRIHLLPKELVELNLSNQNNHLVPFEKADVNPLLGTVIGINKNNSINSTVTESDKSFKQHIQNYKGIQDKAENSKQNVLNLQIFRGNNFKYSAIYAELHSQFISTSSLRELNLSGCELDRWTRLELWKHVEKADFSNNFATLMDPYFISCRQLTQVLLNVKQFLGAGS